MVIATGAAVLALGSCGGGDDATVLEHPSEEAAGRLPSVRNACALVPAQAVAAAVGASPAALGPQPQPSTAGRGAACDYVDAGTGEVVFVVQVQEPPDAAQAMQQVRRPTSVAVAGIGDVASYEQTPIGPSQMAFLKGRRLVRLTSQSRPVRQDVMVGLAQHAVARV